MEIMSLEDFKELELDQTELRQIEDSYATLEGYYDEISKVGRIDRQQAKMLVEHCGVRYKDAPLEMFTTLPSQTNLNVAMEGIGEAAIRIIVDLVKKAVELLIKVANWVVDTIRQRKDRDRQAQRVLKNVQAVAACNEQLRNLGAETISTPPSAKSKIEEYENKLDLAYNTYYSTFSVLMRDVLVNGVESRRVRALNMMFTGLAATTANKVRLFDSVLRAHPRPGREDSLEMSTIAQLKTVSTPWPIDQFGKLLGYTEAGAEDDAYSFLSRYSIDVGNLRTQFAEDQKIALKDAVGMMSNNKSVNNLPYRLDPDVQDKTIRELKTDLQRLSQIRPSNEASDEVRSLFQTSITCIQREVLALEVIVVISEKLAREYDRLLTNSLAVYIHEDNLLNAKIAASGNPEAIKAAQHASEQMRREFH